MDFRGEQVALAIHLAGEPGSSARTPHLGADNAQVPAPIRRELLHRNFREAAFLQEASLMLCVAARIKWQLGVSWRLML